MNIRSIDLQVLIPRTTEVSKAQQTHDHQAALQQQQNAAEWQQLSAARQQQVQRTPQSAGGKVDPDDKREGRGQQEQQTRDEARQAADTESMDGGQDPLRGHHIDIKT